MSYRRLLLVGAVIVPVLSLSACVDRGQADTKLAVACRAAVEALLYEGQKIDEVKEVRSTPSPVGPDYRHISLITLTQDGFLQAESQYDCIFQESFGFMKQNYTASIHQVQMEDRTIGQAGDEVLGSVDEFVKLEEAVRAALYQ